jgi:hypothetical protein
MPRKSIWRSWKLTSCWKRKETKRNEQLLISYSYLSNYLKCSPDPSQQ